MELEEAKTKIEAAKKKEVALSETESIKERLQVIEDFLGIK